MRKKMMFLVSVVVVFTAAVITFSSANGDDPLTRNDVARAIVDQICLDIIPDVSVFPAGEQYEVLANALASRGIEDFVGTNPDELFTVGEMEDIYYILTAGIEIDPADPRANCPVELIPVFAVAPESELTLDNFQKILNCFPDCDPEAEAYSAPEPPGFVPEGPDIIPEEPASEI